jgi:plasmid maintenance system antidote protein VapI
MHDSQQTILRSPAGASRRTQDADAVELRRSRNNEIAHGQQGITAAIAQRPGAYFAVDPQWFMSMQNTNDLHMARETVDMSGIVGGKVA